MNTIRINENKLKSIIKKCLNESLNNYWRGVPEVKMIWHGAWNDPELEYNGYIANYWGIENSLWEDFKEDTGTSDTNEDDEAFNTWLQSNKDSVYSLIMEFGSNINDEIEESNNRIALKIFENKLKNIIKESIKSCVI